MEQHEPQETKSKPRDYSALRAESDRAFRRLVAAMIFFWLTMVGGFIALFIRS